MDDPKNLGLDLEDCRKLKQSREENRQKFKELLLAKGFARPVDTKPVKTKPDVEMEDAQ